MRRVIGGIAMILVLMGMAETATAWNSPGSPTVLYKTALSLQRMDGGLWRTDGTFRPILRITNYLVNQSRVVTPVLYMADGAEYDLPTVTLGAAETSAVDVAAALNQAPTAVQPHISQYGSASVKYTWHWSNAIKAIVQNLDVPRSLNYNFLLRTPMTMGDLDMHHQSVTKEGMWWKEDDGVSGFLGISNTSSHPVSITLVVTAAGVAAQPKIESITLPSHNTAMLTLDLGSSTKGGIRLSYHGDPQDIVLSGGLENALEGYSAQIPFVLIDRSAPEEDIGVGSAGLMNGAPDPMMMFPAGTQFHVYIAVRNISLQKLPVVATIYYMNGESATTVSLPPINLGPNETRFLTSDDLARYANIGDNQPLNLVVKYHGRPSDLIVATGSIDQSKTYVFEVEPETLGIGSSRLLGGWDTANGNDTMISLLNPSPRPHNVDLTLYFAGGSYLLTIRLAPGESKMFSLSDILTMSRQSSGPLDQKGVPTSVTHGSAQIYGRYEGKPSIGVVVSIAIFNVQNATCGTTCPTCAGYTGAYQVTPDTDTVLLGTNATYSAFAQRQSGAWVDVTGGAEYGATAWTKVSGSVTKISQGIYSTYGGGTFSISAQTQLIDYPADCPEGQHSQCPSQVWGGGASGYVQVPTATRTLVPDNYSVQIGPNTHSPYHTCPSGSNGWDRYVNKLVTDQRGGDITVAGMYMSETISINPGQDGLQLHSITAQNVYTVGGGDFGDVLWMCTTLCPGSGETDATQFPDDLVNGFQYTLAANAFRYTCSGNYINGH